jgi:NAD(P)-dependent dehydrogenase (short-subunit alcohol dehydrogenase family)
MAQPQSQVVLITGASSGIGKACAEHLATLGHRVYGTSRKGAGKSGPVEMISMDVTDEGSVKEGVGAVIQKAGRIDVVVNNAGMGIAGAVEETSIDEARMQLDINLLGTLRVCRAVLPSMRKQGTGLIVNISSIGGIIGLPFEGLYSASKFAIEGLTESLRMEVRQFGIRVVLVEPGDIRTAFPENRVWTKESGDGSPYRTLREAAWKVIEHDETNGAAPEMVARLVGKLVEKKSPSVRYPVGLFLQTLAVGLKRVLPQGIFEGIIRSNYKM